MNTDDFLSTVEDSFQGLYDSIEDRDIAQFYVSLAIGIAAEARSLKQEELKEAIDKAFAAGVDVGNYEKHRSN